MPRQSYWGGGSHGPPRSGSWRHSRPRLCSRPAAARMARRPRRRPTTPQEGQLLQSPPAQTGSYSVSDLLSLLSGDSDAAQLLQLAFTPACTVTVYHMEYETVGGKGEATTASGALMVPSGSRLLLPGTAARGALRARHFGGQGLQHRRSHEHGGRRQRRGGADRDGVRGAWIHRGRAELRRVRHLDPLLSSRISWPPSSRTT